MFSFWQLYGHKFVYSPSFYDEFRVFLLTNLTAKLLKIVVSEPLYLILLDFRLVPPLKTVEMDKRA